MANQNKQYDIVLKNGRVIDPETYFDRVCNVGITEGKVVTISEDPLSGKEEKRCNGHDSITRFHRLACPRAKHRQQSGTSL